MRYFWFTLLSISILAIFAGCQRPEPQVPVLIAPEDGAVFDTTKPILIWNASNPEGRYLVVLIVTVGTHSDTSDLIEQSDTTRTLSIEVTECATIKWRVAVEADTGYLWSEIRTFYIDTRENVPALISPADGAVFDSIPPTFVWSKEDVSEYYLRVFKDSLWNDNYLIWVNIQDTSFTMPLNDFKSSDSGTYEWTVGVVDKATGEVMYSFPKTFKVEELPLPPLDLDTTYFPFGLGYEWCYERHYIYNNYGCEEYTDLIDTVKITVTDSFWDESMLLVKLGGRTFFDLSNPVKIKKNQIRLMGYWVNIVPEPDHKHTYEECCGCASSRDFYISYRSDSLKILDISYDWSYGVEYGHYEQVITRVKGIGSLTQRNYSDQSNMCSTIEDENFRLLYFYNGKDTVYKAP